MENQIVEVRNTLTSLEVAEMMGIEHKNLIKKLEGDKTHVGIIPVLSTQLQLELSEYYIVSSYKDGSGKENKCYDITKKGCEMLAHKMTGEKGILFTAKYIERFHQMEEYIKANQSTYKLPQSYSEALLELAATVEAVEKLQVQIEEQAPLVEFATSVQESDDCIDMRRMANLLANNNFNIGRNRLFALLRAEGVLDSCNCPYQRYINAGYFKVVEQVNDNGKITLVSLITGKGQLFISRLVKELNE